MKKHEKWMPLYIAEYLADTSRLTIEQHGAYLLLIMDYWRNGPPPDNPEVLARIVGASQSQWDAIASCLHRYFLVQNGHWRHKRIDEELARARKISELRSEVGAKGRANRDAKNMQLHTPSPSPLHKTLTATATVTKNEKQNIVEQARRILSFLNEKTGRNYRPVKANLEMLTARLAEGATETELRQVVAKKCREWATDEKMALYLRPATLFNRTKFAQYQGELGENNAVS